MTEPPQKSQIVSLIAEMKAAQFKAARLGLVFTASIIGMAVSDIRDESDRRDQIIHVNDNPAAEDDHR